MENKNKESLQAIQHCENVSHDDGLFIQVEQAERPRQAEQEDEHNCSAQPGPKIKNGIVKYFSLDV
jgi:hypothetical protein